MNPRVLTYCCVQNVEQRWCDACRRSIIGGDANFLSHQTSKGHKRKVEESSKKKPTAITNFFRPPLKPQQPIASVSNASSGAQLGTKTTVIDVDRIQEPSFRDRTSSNSAEAGLSDSHSVFEDVTSTDLLRRLRALAASLPPSVPVGDQDEPFACFAAKPEALILPGQDAWEDIIDPTYNRVVGFGKSVPEIAALIRRGNYGMDGFCNWTTACIERMGIASSLLEARLDRVMQAMIHLFVSKFFIIMYAKFRFCSGGLWRCQ